MNLFTRNSPYYHLLNIYYSSWNTLYIQGKNWNSPYYQLVKYLIFLLKHPVYIHYILSSYTFFCSYHDNFEIKIGISFFEFYFMIPY